MFSVNVLLYGDFPQLARRCLSSLQRYLDWNYVDDVRIGCNAVSTATWDEARSFAAGVPAPVLLFCDAADRNVGKYPMMSRMLHGEQPVQSSRVMWFDDDSYLLGSCNFNWTARVVELSRQCSLLGSVYVMPVLGQQAAAVRAQPWFAGKKVPKAFRFCQGAWWVADTEMLRKWNYPFPGLHHSGGDVILGELCRQQSWVSTHFNAGVAINADGEGRESKAVRRGLSVKPKELWRDWSHDWRPDPTLAAWTCEVRRLEKGAVVG